ncbi:CoA transferase subunit A [Streptomyces sp. N50]|uniref:CoA transferase subunit A n=1 Tax=Streptomyces sp. N50 TaxID=3081765 RepID=UPI002961E918|nr:CoA-transferase [Streptomyces sp. N50]WOX07488.1 CoA-transferase [Streptomyces sp. N50]
MDKVRVGTPEAVADIPDGASLAVGGFGLGGVPEILVRAPHEQGATGLEVVSNNGTVDGRRLGLLLAGRRVTRVTGGYVGENEESVCQYLSGELEVELVPPGTLAERPRAGDTDIPAFCTPAGVGTQVERGGLPWRYAPDGSVAAVDFNPLAAMAGRIAVAEVEELVGPGEPNPDEVHLPGVFVQRIVASTPEQAADKHIEKRTARP